MPGSPEPGSHPAAVVGEHRARSSPSANLAVSCGGALRARHEPPRPTASDEPKRVEQDQPGAGGAAGRPCSPGSTSRPTSVMRRTLREVVARPDGRRAASSIGPAKAWPTITIALALCALDLAPQLAGVEAARRQRDDAAAEVHGDERRELAGAVHQRAGRQHRRGPGASGRCGRPARRCDAAGGTPSSALPPAPSTLNRSSWRHITPLGMPVVPPV